MNEEEYIPTKKARQLLGVTTDTLRNWDKANKIQTVRTPSGARLYSVRCIQNILNSNRPRKEKKKIAYCRVSSQKQVDDLKRQENFFKQNYPDFELVTDIGSGINWKRKGLKTILERAMSNDISEVMVAHRDRLCRFGFELLEWLFEKYHVKLIVLDREEHKSEDFELTDDILSIIHVYSCRQMGKRRYSMPKNKNLSFNETKTDDESMDRDDSLCL